MGNFDSTFIAIIAHKGFATFSAGSLMLGSVPDTCWFMAGSQRIHVGVWHILRPRSGSALWPEYETST